ncbi:hypothetical protein PN419_01175 [Halorubrum ezzemoulense]|jgi:hypothetical protein|uniref:Type IV pilin n=1 Tax=Halorubrum ezzemoulense TaxID=337243 RepID=A0A256J8U2_HALEZ|nr:MULTISPECIES: hypothetical protein [Halorubrum]MDB2237258.1 hypothetical protein [Halorubrum ezzemoulense]MDB2245445.1 hypothetical protein [Halorubrum ezzemoulense]MDB2246792.1 hypothetical protein [Halorubrum ezzemoulense]MDB2250331.1 hypothetical protein [Halorubrum ezzemoulense]MDB2279177.1 hypothetical protein [Halorubrum ezzemoulense]
MTGADRGAAFLTADRGVSETVGFVLVFALITSTIAVTFTVGLGGLEDAQLAERDDNVERAFDVLHDNFNDIGRDGVPSRATELRLGGGRLAFDRVSEFRLNDTGTETAIVEGGSITYYGAGDTRIVYENGAVFRMEGNDGVMVKEPDLLVGDTIVYSLYGLSPPAESVSGDRTVLVVAERTDREVAIDDRTADQNVTLAINSTQATVWKRYYDGFDGVTTNMSGPADLTVTFAADDYDRFVVHRTTARVEFSD